MRVVQSTGFYYPDSSGGTEVYVSSLAKNLRALGIECAVAAPSSVGKACYDHEGIAVFRYPVPANWRRGEVQGRVAPRWFDVFEGWLRQQKADIYHQHSWTSACSLWHLQAAKRLGLKTIVTIHVPGPICLRGTMLYEGRTACDGEIRPQRCATCWLQSRGMTEGCARRLALLPQWLGPLARVPQLGPAVAAKALVLEHKAQLDRMVKATDRIVAVCGWLCDVLITNGVPAEKLVLNRQGIEYPAPVARSRGASQPNEVVRLGFLGRCDPLKGLHFLIDAFRRMPAEAPVALEICASGLRDTGTYGESILRAAALDSRITIRPDIAHGEVAEFLGCIDALAVPSQWLETGPLVVLEAFAAGTPVIGSNLGGIKELLRHERNGLLLPHDDVAAWTAALMRLVKDRMLLERLRHGIGPVRSVSDVAREMAALYRQLSEVDVHAA